MQLKRTVKASSSHNAHWFDAKKDELVQLYGDKSIELLIADIRNGVPSTNNLKVERDHFGVVLLNMKYSEWFLLGKPESALSFEMVRFEKM
ncbi:hypothetical protein [Vibrio anguillarum]|uniref:Uncharacterized protein n=1 Tax=Vibrio anguillarum TaxID=55601 RepID=A0A7U6J3I3_VIBAN|nr:hypothetical protein [Vibrio anguillarum]AZS26376.1 hypothetical protein DYL72_15850 [Vibrio anguillarum]MBF4374502.1 hypothetical protein [Vibrio anguillarum]MBF4437749.1 hypothetical protein [Vibrio anguillarum]